MKPITDVLSAVDSIAKRVRQHSHPSAECLTVSLISSTDSTILRYLLQIAGAGIAVGFIAPAAKLPFPRNAGDLTGKDSTINIR